LLSDAGHRNLEVLLPAVFKGHLLLFLVSIAYLVWRFPVTTQGQRVWLFDLVLVWMVSFSPLLWYNQQVFLLAAVGGTELVLTSSWFRASSSPGRLLL
jgi:hypothetical protein